MRVSISASLSPSVSRSYCACSSVRRGVFFVAASNCALVKARLSALADSCDKSASSNETRPDCFGWLPLLIDSRDSLVPVSIPEGGGVASRTTGPFVGRGNCTPSAVSCVTTSSSVRRTPIASALGPTCVTVSVPKSYT